MPLPNLSYDVTSFSPLHCTNGSIIVDQRNEAENGKENRDTLVWESLQESSIVYDDENSDIDDHVTTEIEYDDNNELASDAQFLLHALHDNVLLSSSLPSISTPLESSVIIREAVVTSPQLFLPSGCAIENDEDDLSLNKSSLCKLNNSVMHISAPDLDILSHNTCNEHLTTPKIGEYLVPTSNVVKSMQLNLLQSAKSELDSPDVEMCEVVKSPLVNNAQVTTITSPVLILSAEMSQHLPLSDCLSHDKRTASASRLEMSDFRAVALLGRGHFGKVCNNQCQSFVEKSGL